MFRENKQSSENNHFPFWVLTLVGWTFFLACLQSYRKKSPDRSCLKDSKCNMYKLPGFDGCQWLHGPEFWKKILWSDPERSLHEALSTNFGSISSRLTKTESCRFAAAVCQTLASFFFFCFCRQKWGANEGKYFEVKPVPNLAAKWCPFCSHGWTVQAAPADARTKECDTQFQKNTGVSQHAFET